MGTHMYLTDAFTCRGFGEDRDLYADIDQFIRPINFYNISKITYLWQEVHIGKKICALSITLMYSEFL